jgi:glutamate--cysteine ligase
MEASSLVGRMTRGPIRRAPAPVKFEALEATFARSLSYFAQRIIGAEFELLVIDGRGRAAPLRDVQAVFADLAERGWKALFDSESHERIGAARAKPIFDFRTQVGFDTGYPILEIALAPRATLGEIDDDYDGMLDLLLPLLHRRGLRLLSYGIQPLTAPSFRLLAPRPRYRFFVRRYGSTQANMTIIAATQSNVNALDARELVQSLNVMLALVPVQNALFENSPVWEGKTDSRYRSIRPMFWYGRNEPWRVGMPPAPFSSLEDYLRRIWELETFLVQRGDRTYEVEGNPPFHRYLEYGGVGRDVNTGRRIELEPTREDIQQHNGFVWWDSRVQTPPRSVYLENRVASAQPPGEELTVLAFHLGLVESANEAAAILEDYSWEDLRAARLSALTHTLGGKIGRRPIAALARQMVDVAHAGLAARGLGEERYLEPLYERIDKRESPADRTIKIFRKEGLEGLLRATELRR